MKYLTIVTIALMVCVTGWSIAARPVSRQDQGPSGETVYSARDVTEKAKIKSKPLPHYTEEARQHGVHGTVVLKMVLRASGDVTDITVVKGLPYGLSEEGIRAAQGIKFEPAMKDDHKVSQSIMVEYEFHLY